MPILEWLPATVPGQSVRAWDLASSATGDWTVGLRWDLLADPQYRHMPIISDLGRVRGMPDVVRRLVQDVAAGDTYETKIAFTRGS